MRGRSRWRVRASPTGPSSGLRPPSPRSRGEGRRHARASVPALSPGHKSIRGPGLMSPGSFVLCAGDISPDAAVSTPCPARIWRPGLGRPLRPLTRRNVVLRSIAPGRYAGRLEGEPRKRVPPCKRRTPGRADRCIRAARALLPVHTSRPLRMHPRRTGMGEVCMD